MMEPTSCISRSSSHSFEKYRFFSLPKITSLPRLVYWGYGVGHVFNDLCSAMWFTYMLVFFQLVIGLNAAKSGLIVLIGQVADAVATPAIGLWSDRGKMYCLDRLGKRRAWYIVGTIFVACSFPYIYSPCLGCQLATETLQVVYYSVFVVLFQLGWAAVQTVHLALASDLVPLGLDRTQLLSLRNTFTVLCNIFVYFLAYVLLEAIDHTTRLSTRDLYKFQIMIAIILCVGLTTSIVFVCNVKEDPCFQESTRPLLRKTTVSSLASVLKRLSLYLVALVYMSTRLFNIIVQILTPLYLHETLNLEAYFIAVIPLVMYIAGFVTSIMCGFLSRKIGEKTLFLISILLVNGASLWIFLGNGPIYETYVLYLIAGIYGGAGSILLVAALSITSFFIGPDVGNSAFVFGIMSFTDKLCSGLTVMAVQYFKPEGVSMYYKDSLAGITAGSVTVAAIGVLLVPRSKPTDLDTTFTYGSTTAA